MTQTTATVLMSKAEDLRVDEPVLWAIVRSRGRLDKIGILSGQGPKATREAIAKYLSQNLIHESTEHPNVYILSPHHHRYQDLNKLRQFYELIELKWLDDLEVRPEKGQVSPTVEKKWRELHPEQASKIQRFDETLTMKQAQFLVLLSNLGPTFRPLDAAKAQGFTQAGYTKGSLESLANKGFVEETQPRPSTWQLTDAGVEQAQAARDKGIKPRMKERLPENTVDDL